MATPAAVLSILVKAQGIQSTAGDLRQLDTNARKAGMGIETAEKKGSKSLDKLGKQTSLTGRLASNGFSRIAVAATGAAAAIGGVGLVAKKAVDAAVDLGEQVNKTAVVFRGAEKPVLAWATTTATSIGISNRAALEATGTFGNMLVPMGFARKEAAKLSVDLVKLAADLASFNNAAPEEVLESLRAGLSGETEPLRKFGIFLNEARVKAEAMSLGLVKATKDTTKIQSAQITAALAQKNYNAAVKEHGKGSAESQKALVTLNNAQGALNKVTSGSIPVLTAAQKAQATYSLILKDTKDAQGDFSRTSTSLANQQRILKAQFEDVAAKLGVQLIPALTAAALALSKFITEMEDGTGKGGQFVTVVKSMAHNFSEFARHCREDADMLLGAFVTIVDGVGQVARTLSAIDPTGAMGKVADRAQRAADKINKLRETIRPAGHEFDNLNDAADSLGDSLASNFEKGRSGANVLGHAITTVNTKFAGLQKAADAALGTIGDALKKPAGALKHVGDGIGIPKMGGGAPGKGSAALMGANSSLAPFARIGAGFGLHVSSGLRPGAITSSGNPSYHGTGEAIDVAGDPRGMIGFFNAMKSKYGSRLAELIYTPGGMGIKNGSPFTYTGRVARDHFDHVHVALDTGAPGPGDGIGKVRGARKALTGDGIGTAVDAARKAGFSGTELVNMVAIAARESGYDPTATNFKYPDHSIGLWQINQLAHKGKYGTDAQLKNPYTNAKAARDLFKQRGYQPWHGFVGVTKEMFAKARAAVTGSRSSGGDGGGGASAGAMKAQLEKNLDKIDALRTKIRNLPAGKKGAAKRKALQDQIAKLQTTDRHLRTKIGAAGKGVSGFEQAMATADVDIASSKETGSSKTVGGVGARKVSNALQKAYAVTAKQKLVGARIKKIRAALKGKLTPSTKLRLTQELAQRLGEHQDLGKQAFDLRHPAAADTGGDTGGSDVGGDVGGDDAAAAAQQAADEAATKAMEELAEQLRITNAKLELQSQLAQEALRKYNVSQSDYGTLTKALASIVSGEIGGRVGLGFMSPGFSGSGGSRY